MIYELVYTSAPRGLKPGSRGFATVAQTKGIPNALSEALEALSGYEFVFPLGSPDYARNPVNLSHLRLFVGGQRYHVLSRVAAADADYTGRTNKFAHHIALTEDEVAKHPAGPASLMRIEEFFLTEWKGDPAWIVAEKPLSATPLFQGVCSTWKTLTGDAGWAGVAADALLNSSDKPVYLLQAPGRIDDKTWAVLLDELLSLLPPSERWDTTFSTYFTQIPSGVQGCEIRGIIEGTNEQNRTQMAAKVAVIDLTKQISMNKSDLSTSVQNARSGTRIQTQIRKQTSTVIFKEKKVTSETKDYEPSHANVDVSDPSSIHAFGRNKNRRLPSKQNSNPYTRPILVGSIIAFLLILVSASLLITLTQTVPQVAKNDIPNKTVNETSRQDNRQTTNSSEQKENESEPKDEHKKDQSPSRLDDRVVDPKSIAKPEQPNNTPLNHDSIQKKEPLIIAPYSVTLKREKAGFDSIPTIEPRIHIEGPTETAKEVQHVFYPVGKQNKWNVDIKRLDTQTKLQLNEPNSLDDQKREIASLSFSDIVKYEPGPMLRNKSLDDQMSALKGLIICGSSECLIFSDNPYEEPDFGARTKLCLEVANAGSSSLTFPNSFQHLNPTIASASITVAGNLPGTRVSIPVTSSNFQCVVPVFEGAYPIIFKITISNEAGPDGSPVFRFDCAFEPSLKEMNRDYGNYKRWLEEMAKMDSDSKNKSGALLEEHKDRIQKKKQQEPDSHVKWIHDHWATATEKVNNLIRTFGLDVKIAIDRQLSEDLVRIVVARVFIDREAVNAAIQRDSNQTKGERRNAK